MNFNWLVIPTLAIALSLFFLGQRSVKCRATTKGKASLSILYLLLGLPGFLMALYYLHGFDDAVWFYEFRAIPFSELTAAGAGLFAGALAELFKSRVFIVIVLVLGIIAPHSKPLLAPLDSAQLVDRWEEDVCLQSTPSTCGLASAATVFRIVGESLSEHELAAECFTYQGGTENWYIARAFRRRGYEVTYRIEKRGFLEELRTPAIAGVRIGGVGHFISILGVEGGTIITGDPLIGRQEFFINEINTAFDFTGFFMEVESAR